MLGDERVRAENLEFHSSVTRQGAGGEDRGGRRRG
jgi:hypothetical protein